MGRSWAGTHPLTAALADHTVLRYRRTVPLDGRQFGIEDDAVVCARLLRHVGLARRLAEFWAEARARACRHQPTTMRPA